MSLIAAFFCMLALIIHPGTCLIVTLLIAMVEVELYGLLAWTGLKLNAVVTVNLIMSMGIAVEFLAHIARAFMLEQGGGRGLFTR
jgi:Niemann-Pick C1 protein